MSAGVKSDKRSRKSAEKPSGSSKKRRLEDGTAQSNSAELTEDTEADAIHPSRRPGHSGDDRQTGLPNGTSSREAHQKQKALKQERLAAKPNYDSIARSKKLWEKLRIKSKIPKEERKQLVDELFSIITGRVKEFVFKHDSVRVIQCALKYATPEQKQQIAKELSGSYRELAESKYAKFLVAKLIVQDDGSRDVIVPEFYGHVKRLMRHPEASWIVDDIYRTLATTEQKARLLREWYGPEFVVFAQDKNTAVTADLATILKESPQKRAPIMLHLKEMTNQLVQKKTTGFTMLHDALLQYFLNCQPGTSEHSEFLDMLRDDEEGDLFKNLAFTKSGSRVVCLALAYGTSKDRRNILKHFKTHIKTLAADAHGHLVLLAAYEVIDDTVMAAKAIFPELTGKELDTQARNEETLALATHLNGRIPLLHTMSATPPKWLVDTPQSEMLKEIRDVRASTSKKEPETRRLELNKAVSEPLLAFIAAEAGRLVETSFGCQFISEVVLGGTSDKKAAVQTIAGLANTNSEHRDYLGSAHAGRMLKSLAQGGRFDPHEKTVKAVEPAVGFADVLFEVLKEQEDGIVKYATGPNSFVIVGMLESVDFQYKDELKMILSKSKSAISSVPADDKTAYSGCQLILAQLGEATDQNVDPVSKSNKRAHEGKPRETIAKTGKKVKSKN